MSSGRWLKGIFSDELVPKQVKLDAIKHQHLLSRCDEEILLLKEEIKSTVLFYLQDWQQLVASIEEMETKPCTQYISGALCLLQLARLQCEGVLQHLSSSFSPFVNSIHLPVDKFLSHAIGGNSERKLMSFWKP